MSIQIENVSLWGKNGIDQKKVLDNVTCTIPGGSITLLIGVTGSGKTTLLKAVAGLTKLDEGMIRYHGEPLWSDKQKLQSSINRKLGFVFQHPEHQLFAPSIRKEFEFSLKPFQLSKEEIATRIKTSLNEMELDEELLEENPFNISGGQKRRIALATTLATEPEWLFLDEPTSGLDPQGTVKVRELLCRWKLNNTQGSMMIATHDLDTFLPIADQVLIMNRGKLVAQCSREELIQQPQLLVENQIGLPNQLLIAVHLREIGIHLPNRLLPAEELAHKIMEHKQGVEQQDSSANRSSLEMESSSACVYTQAAATSKRSNPSKPTIPSIPSTPSTQKLSRRGLLIQEIDPRAKWLFYILLSISILWQNTWSGVALASLISVVIVMISGAPIGKLLKMTKPFIYFMLITVLVAGLKLHVEAEPLRIEAVSFLLEPALKTAKQFSKFFVIMLVGFLLPLTTSHLLLKRGMEQGLSPLKKVHFPVEAMALGASLMFRFIPVIMSEVERFSLIARARGKADVKPGKIRVRDIKVMSIPLLLSILRLAEELSMALEARGYKETGQQRTSSVVLTFKPLDVKVIGIGCLLSFVLILFHLVDRSI